MRVKAEFPVKLQQIFQPSRYKVLHGGRGGSKSWAVARALLILGAQKPLRILCARELQKSIKDSVHRLLSDQIYALQLDSRYEIQQGTIKGTNGTEFFFEGLRHNTQQIKSYEGVDIVWVEEAQTTSKSSWDVLIPTIRKDNSEIWITFNPELEEDETYQRFVVNPPSNSIVININWRDNPWFPDVLRQEMEDLKKRDPIAYETVWEGHCRQAVEGAIFTDELNELHENQKIVNVPYDAKKLVNTFWDLGHGDQTSIWFVQKFGFEYRVIDFYQNARKKIQHYIQVLQARGYVYGTDYLPHDGNSNHLTGLTVEETLKEIGRAVDVVPRVGRKIDSINATRALFPMCYFDKNKCAEGLQALRRYRYKIDPDTGKASKDPEHDIYSDAADAFQTFGTAPHIMWEAHTGGGGEFKAEYDPFDESRL
jgi:phage terminase large subunit